MTPLRCGRLDEHRDHHWTRPASIYGPARTYACSGHVVTSVAEQRWATGADADEAADDELREWLRGWAV